MVYAAVLAGGAGKRMQKSGRPKQFLPLGDKCILQYTAEQFTINPNIGKVLIIVPEDWLTYAESLFSKDDFAGSYENKVIIAQGGDDRNSSLMNAANKIKDLYGVNHDDIIMSHDAARPFVTQRIIDENIKECFIYGAVDTVYVLTDTPVVSVDGATVSEIPARSKFYVSQTPQTFNIRLLMDVYSSLAEDEKADMTDACKMFVIRDKPVKIVMGEIYNFKITTPFDYAMALAYIRDGFGMHK